MTGTDAGEMVTARVAVTDCGTVDVFELARAVADRLKVVAVSDAGTVTVNVRPEGSVVSGAMVTVASSAVRVGLASETVELSLAVAVRKKLPDCPAVMAAMVNSPKVMNRYSDWKPLHQILLPG